jgi:hypothetical protein
MGYHIMDSQVMVKVLINLTNDYELQIVLMEKHIENKENPLTIDELQEELSLRYESLSLYQKQSMTLI